MCNCVDKLLFAAIHLMAAKFNAASEAVKS